MSDVTETPLPGVGVRYEFTTDTGDAIGVIVHRTGRREVVVYDEQGADECATMLQLSPADARTMAELLGATRVSEVSAALQQEIEGLAIEWLRLDAASGFVGHSIAEGKIRTRTGVSIVAILRGSKTIPAPLPSAIFQLGDVVVAVGTLDGLQSAREILGAS